MARMMNPPSPVMAPAGGMGRPLVRWTSSSGPRGAGGRLRPGSSSTEAPDHGLESELPADHSVAVGPGAQRTQRPLHPECYANTRQFAVKKELQPAEDGR